MYRLIAMTLIITLTSMMTTTPLAAATDDIAANVNQASSVELLRAYVEKLPIGSIVKVKMKEGKDVKGTLMVIEPDAIVVKPKTRLARPERRLPYTDVEFVEVQTKNGANIAKSAAIGVGTGVGAFFGLLLLTFVIIDD